jgi:hypothetical protein
LRLTKAGGVRFNNGKGHRDGTASLAVALKTRVRSGGDGVLAQAEFLALVKVCSVVAAKGIWIDSLDTELAVSVVTVFD